MTGPDHSQFSSSGYDVIVVGGGIMGAATTYYLAKSGIKVALFEKGRLGGEQSSRNWGAVRQQGRHPAEVAMMMESNRIWQGLSQDLQSDVDWRQQGQLRVAYNAAALARYEEWMPVAREFGLDTKILSPGQVHELLPNFSAQDCRGGMFTPSDGCAEPEKVTIAFGRAAVQAGAAVFVGCSVSEIETTNGTVCGVLTERGRVRADAVVCTSGAWTSRLLRPLRVRHPSLWVRGSVGQTEPINVDLRKLVVWGKAAYRQRPDGTLTLAAAEDGQHDIMFDSARYGLKFLGLARENWRNLRFAVGKPLVDDVTGKFRKFSNFRELDPRPDLSGLDRAASAFASEYPGAGKIVFKRKWAGWIDYMPDELPVIGQAPGIGGCFLAAGFSGHGFGMGPVVGRVVADLVQNKATGHDMRPFRSERFN